MTTATEYPRVSRDKSGRLRSVSEQSEENRDASDVRGWEWLPTRYAEDGEASASVFGTVERIGFQALLHDLCAGAFPADVLVLWASSRGSRQMREWVDLLDALTIAGVLLHITEDERTYDPRKPKDRHDLQDAANDAELYSGQLSSALKRAARAGAREGLPNGRPPWGYMNLWSEDGKSFERVPDPRPTPGGLPTKEYVRRAYQEIANGGSVAGIVKRWNRTGETGRKWTTQALRVMLLNPAYAGVRVHAPRSRHEPRGGPSTEYEAAWEPIVTPDLAARVRVLLSDPARVKQRSSGVTHLLSNIARCACGSALRARTAGGRSVYTCATRGCVQIAESELDDFVRDVTIAYLAREQVGPMGDPDAAELARAQKAVSDAEAYLREVKQAAEQGTSPLLVSTMETNGQARLQSARAELRRVSLPDALALVLPEQPMTRETWDAMTLVGRRRLLRALYEPDAIVGALTIIPGARGRRVDVADRVTFG